MSDTITRFKFFWADQDEQQETWLRSMAQQGLQLVDVNPLCFWTFRRGAPSDIVYRVNYSRNCKETDFHQLMRDAGWTLAATTVGWQYWRIPVVSGKAPQIFTDDASRVRKFKQLLGVLVASATPLTVWCIVMTQQGILQRLSTPSLVVLGLILGVWALLVPYGALRLLLKIRRPRALLPG